MPTEITEFTAYPKAFTALAALQLVDIIEAQSPSILQEWGIRVRPRAMSSIMLLHKGDTTVTEIAEAVGQSHPAVIKNIKPLQDVGFVKTRTSRRDKRKKILTLTPSGKREAENLEAFFAAADKVFANLFKEINCDLLTAITDAQKALQKTSFSDRFTEIQKNEN